MNRQDTPPCTHSHRVTFTRKEKRLRKKRSSTVSAAAIGFASVVAASSHAVAGFSVPTLPANTNPTRVAVRRKSRRTNSASSNAGPSLRVSTQFFYRESDEHDHVSRRQEHHEAVAAISSQHMNRYDNDKALAAWSAWLEPLMHVPTRKPKNDDNKQIVLDDYLEFLDRRYNRLHRNDMEETPLGINTAYDWLLNRSPSSHPAPARREDDSLCVLGLAGLASAELLRKHNLPLPEERQLKIIPASSVVVETNLSTMHGSVPPELEKMTTPSNRAACISTIQSSLSAGTRILRRIRARRDAIFAMQLHKVLLASMRQSWRKALVLTKKAIALGGGKQNLQLATAIVLSFLILLRPICAAVVQG